MTEPIERARISFWWPTSGHAVWSEPVGSDAGRAGATPWTYCFSVPFFKVLVTRKYRMLRRLGTPPIAARWAVNTECQRQFNCTTAATWRGDDFEVPPGTPMCFFPPEPCQTCGEFGHDEYSDYHPSEGDEYDD
jgi:hypothetical protein